MTTEYSIDNGASWHVATPGHLAFLTGDQVICYRTPPKTVDEQALDAPQLTDSTVDGSVPTLGALFASVGGWMAGGELGYPSFGSMDALRIYTQRAIRAALSAAAPPHVKGRTLIEPITSLNDDVRVHTAVAIKIDKRWFCGIGKSGRIQTAWSLAGAKMIIPTKFGLAEAAAIAEQVKAKRPRSIVEVKMLGAIDDRATAQSAHKSVEAE
jgi:hypothetical protein